MLTSLRTYVFVWPWLETALKRLLELPKAGAAAAVCAIALTSTTLLPLKMWPGMERWEVDSDGHMYEVEHTGDSPLSSLRTRSSYGPGPLSPAMSAASAPVADAEIAEHNPEESVPTPEPPEVLEADQIETEENQEIAALRELCESVGDRLSEANQNRSRRRERFMQLCDRVHEVRQLTDIHNTIQAWKSIVALVMACVENERPNQVYLNNMDAQISEDINAAAQRTPEYLDL